jgi:hypothetical protein
MGSMFHVTLVDPVSKKPSPVRVSVTFAAGGANDKVDTGFYTYMVCSGACAGQLVGLEWTSP